MKKHLIWFMLILVLTSAYSQEYGRELDSLALVALYDSTDGANWNSNENWLSGEPIDNWHGVTVVDNRVTQLSLRSNNLNGTIPVEICNLTALENLDFYVNSLIGPIPEDIGNLYHLVRLYLNHNQLEGNIPESLWQLTSLQHLYLNSNNLTGSLPAEVGNLVDLEYLVLFANSFSDSIPESIGQLSKLRELNIYRNGFSGIFPESITNCDSLRELTLWNNVLEGQLPEDIDKLFHLERISVANNRFSGSIPESIGTLSQLNFLDLGSNAFEGLIPESIGNLTNLTFLRLGSNDLSGSIPDTLGNLVNLSTMYLNYNDLTGPIPSALGQLTDLTALLLNGNRLNGTVPTELTNLTNLTTLYISDNQLHELPDLSSLSNLISFSIQNNQFTFEDIEPNIGFSSESFIYSPQADIGTEVDTTINLGDAFSMSVFVGGDNNTYQWYKDDLPIPQATSTTYEISSAAVADSGTYICRVTNSVVTDLTISSQPLHLSVVDPTGVSDSDNLRPKQFALLQNYPNPFNPVTRINYQLPMSDYVELSIYNLLGQKVAILVSEKQNAGHYHVEWNASGFASGVYYYRLSTGEGFVQTKKCIVFR
jgi:Leucine-rich repeat (LRR) protein